MIFVTVGSQKFQFNRLLKEIDRLIEIGRLEEEVFAQIGYSDYIPKNYNYKKFLNRDEIPKIMNKCNKVITHGGTGAIIGAVKQNKKVVAIPRLKEFGEHIDNHQIEIINEFSKENLIVSVNDINELEVIVDNFDKFELSNYESNTKNIINNIDMYISRI